MPDYTFPEMLARFGTTTSTPPLELPTEPGLYVVRGATGDEWAADLFSRDPEGFWYHLQRREITDEQLRLYIGSHPLERLHRHSEVDQ
jgi:hypothetical protein